MRRVYKSSWRPHRYLYMTFVMLKKVWRARGHAAGGLLALAICLNAAAKSSSQASLEVANSQFVRSSEPYFRDGASNSLTSWKLGWKGEAESRGFFSKADIRNDYQAEEEHHYIKPFDLHVGWSNENTRLVLGRARQDWSKADELWRIGMWQPRFTDDQIERENAGFTGLFLKTGNERAHFLFFASPIWVPDQQASFAVKDQKFVSKNPWFKPPTTVVNLQGVETDVRYKFHRPEELDVVQHAMVATQFEYRPSQGSFARVSATYKPINQLLIGFPLELHEVVPEPRYATIEVETRVLYQQMVTAEAGVQDMNRWTAWASLSSDRPVRDNPPSEWTTQEVSSAVIGSIYAGRDLRGSGSFASHVFASYLRVDGGNAPDRGEILGTKSFFEPRYIFQDAIQLGARHSLNLFTSKWLARLGGSVTYDFGQHGILTSFSLAQPLSKYWSASASADFIGLVDRSGRKQDGFTSTYRANDRVSIGVQYVY